MSWEKGKYYTRSRRVRGRVVREYVGRGELAELIAKMDGLERERREHQRESQRLEREELEAIDASVIRICHFAEIIATAALVSAGLHNHRGEWRRRRVQG